jgi:hypothetical protein
VSPQSASWGTFLAGGPIHDNPALAALTVPGAVLDIDDPSGEPLAGAPDPLLGGVYAGNLTPRMPAQLIPGALNTGAVGTAFLGRSPDGSTKAVFAVITADRAIVQEHTLRALDGLAPTSTVGSVLDEPVDMAPVVIEPSDPNWSSNTTLDVNSDIYAANRGNNTIVRMHQDGTVLAI